MICINCNFITDDDSVFCPKCGKKMSAPTEDKEATARFIESLNTSASPSGMISSTDVFAALDKAYNEKKSEQLYNTANTPTPPINTSAFVKKPNKIKHNSESEKRIALGNAQDKINNLIQIITDYISSEFKVITEGYRDAGVKKLSRLARKVIKNTHNDTQSGVKGHESLLRHIEQQLEAFGGQNTVLLSRLDELWSKFDELIDLNDSRVKELLEYSKRGAIGSNECDHGLDQLNKWRSELTGLISEIKDHENKMTSMLNTCNYDTTLFLKSLKNTNTAEFKKYQKSVKKSYKSSRFNAPSIICMVLVIAGLVLSYYFFKTIKRDTSIEVHIIGSIILGSWALGFYHIYHIECFNDSINFSLSIIKETWYFIFFPPIWGIMCFGGLFSVMCCTIFGFFTGPIFMVLDPIRFLLGKQCIRQDQ